MEIHEIIKNRRMELGLTLKEVANALGIAESTVSRYENSNIQNMGIDKVVALAKVLKCSPTYLLGWTDSCTNNDIICNKLNGDDYTEDEINKIKEYAEFIKYNRKSIPSTSQAHFEDVEEAKEYLKSLKMFAAFGGQKGYSDETILKMANIIYKEKGEQ